MTNKEKFYRTANVVLIGYSIYKTIEYGIAYYNLLVANQQSATIEEKKMGFVVGDDLNDRFTYAYNLFRWN